MSLSSDFTHAIPSNAIFIQREFASWKVPCGSYLIVYHECNSDGFLVSRGSGVGEIVLRVLLRASRESTCAVSVNGVLLHFEIKRWRVLVTETAVWIITRISSISHPYIFKLLIRNFYTLLRKLRKQCNSLEVSRCYTRYIFSRRRVDA